jgi:hypothetical protein
VNYPPPRLSRVSGILGSGFRRNDERAGVTSGPE